MGKLYVICGHGAGDSGACGNGYQEAERVRALGKRIAELGGSNVVLLDTNRNWYADKGINSLSVPDDSWLVELHMDSASASARGGHVIINAGIGGADKWDRALASMIATIFPGRSQTIVERSDLANPKRASQRGINYRLVENGFISNAQDVAVFNSRLDDLARGYLAAFGLDGGAQPGPSAPVEQPSTGGVDLGGTDWWGPKFTRELQRQRGTTVDGIVSKQPKANAKYFWAVEDSTRTFGDGGSDVILSLQQMLANAGYDPNGLDRKYGKGAISAHQRWLNANLGAGLEIDGKHGHATNRAMYQALQQGLYR